MTFAAVPFVSFCEGFRMPAADGRCRAQGGRRRKTGHGLGVICKRQHSRFAWRALVGTASKPAAIWNRQGADEGVAGQGRSPDCWRHRPAPCGRAQPGTGRHYRISRRAGGAAQVDLDAEELIALFDGRPVTYGFGELDMLVPAYATAIHKSQGSEYPAVVIPVM